MDRYEMYEVNDKLENFDPTNTRLPEDMFTRFNGPEADLMKRQLAMPMKFRFVRYMSYNNNNFVFVINLNVEQYFF